MKKNRRFIYLIILVLGISVGYAALSNNLKINGVSAVKKSTWNIYWDSVSASSYGNVDVVNAATITDTKKTVVDYSVVLNEPGDYYEFTVDAVNDGTLDGMIKTIVNDGLTDDEKVYVDYSVTYNDGKTLQEGHLLKAGSREKYKVRVLYKTDINPNQLPNTDKVLDLKFEVEYVQANDDAVERATILCRRAKVLHTEVWNPNDVSERFCTSNNHERGSLVTYGNLGSGSSLNVGDAFDCDVDNNGKYDNDERFYYLYNLNSDTAVLIFYNNVEKGEASESYVAAYDLQGNAYENGPQTAILDLPTEVQWPNARLVSKKVNIYDNNGTLRKENFSYEGYAARLLSLKDLDIATGTNIEGNSQYLMTKGYYNNFEFLFENTYYTQTYDDNADVNDTNAGYWINTPFAYTSNLDHILSPSDGNLGSPAANLVKFGVRPVIEIPISDIEH